MGGEDGAGSERSRASFGSVLEVIEVGAVTVTRRYSCIRRDQYELRAPGGFPAGLRERLAGRGSISGGAALYVLDVPGELQLTVAPGAGRALLMPRLATEPPGQREAALAIAGEIDALVSGVAKA